MWHISRRYGLQKMPEISELQLTLPTLKKKESIKRFKGFVLFFLPAN